MSWLRPMCSVNYSKHQAFKTTQKVPMDTVYSSVVVLGLEMSSRTNFESLALALKVKSLALALAKQVLGLAGRVICQTNNTATMRKSTFIA